MLIRSFRWKITSTRTSTGSKKVKKSDVLGTTEIDNITMINSKINFEIYCELVYLKDLQKGEKDEE